MDLSGSCHCGNLAFVLQTRQPPEQLPVRACQCSFCRRHGALSTSDPEGRVALRIVDAAHLQRYRFGLRTADFLVCTRCGVYVGAVTEIAQRHYCVLNVNAFDERARFTQLPQPMVYDAETAQHRDARRALRWTPVTAA